MNIPAFPITNYDIRADINEAEQDVRAGRPPQRSSAAYAVTYFSELRKLPTTPSGYIIWGIGGRSGDTLRLRTPISERSDSHSR
ncbi:MAG: hypothetical protein AAFQ57_17485 [Cyanobacteria bacterium J06626_14]